ncbi:MAG: hypothetical protein MJ010_05560 [Paludibacteraceae bacterium]|nr:hypothetical protein [Paludibacteraceae bacterium]
MKVKVFFLFLLFISSLSYADGIYNNLNIRSFQVNLENDTVQYIKADTSLTVKKPVILFLIGSRAYSLIDKKSTGELGVIWWESLNYKSLSEKYHLVMLANPGVPVETSESELDDDGCYVTNKDIPHSYPEKYLKSNNLEYYADRADKFVDYLKEQAWVDSNKIYVIGHSQGTYVAVEVAKRNKNVAAIGYFSGSPLGRASQYIAGIRRQEAQGIIDSEEAQKQIDGLYEWWEWQVNNIDYFPADGSDSPKTTCSFSVMQLFDIADLKQPVYVAYGTKNVGSLFCDYLPLLFIRNGKQNWKVKAYPGLEHNFYKVKENGTADYDGPTSWPDAIDEFVKWLELMR